MIWVTPTSPIERTKRRSSVRTERIFSGYNSSDGYSMAFDEMFDGNLRVRPHYAPLHRRLLQLGTEEFRRRKAMTDLSMLQDGVGFTVYRQEEGIERVWPMDPVPRIIPAREWAAIE